MMLVHWFRRDLRLHDNHALNCALQSGKPVLPIFIFDTAILDKLENKTDARVQFIHQEIENLQEALTKMGSTLWVYYGNISDAFDSLTHQFTIHSVFANEDYENYALQRDEKVKLLLAKKEIAFKSFKDHVIHGAQDVLKKDNTPYTVFTPYSKTWKQQLNEQSFSAWPSHENLAALIKIKPFKIPTLFELGFKSSPISFPTKKIDTDVIAQYAKNRDIPGIKGTSRLGLHLRFGTLSIRETAQLAQALSEKWLHELIWRDFYSSILVHFPYVEKSAFKPNYNRIEWRNNVKEFNAWCAGQTGYPLVDAGMRELNATGFMHNRVRMLVASFLCKHLLIDWRWGEAYFAQKLLDFDLASNNGGWQWAAGCGVDAAPYFRIFNPQLQQQKFDPQFAYIKQWVKEWDTSAYPQPIVDHKIARARCLSTYKKALSPS